ncbi:MAG TPA: UDP-N-acetylmuramoyl-L-alanine--D-glutamate ligase [Bacteroidetes bacterium]|nr:UDP-N-acetylmuramoyl-L-alanine--D-glutamate ligase [Bacteroidota bacterium]
MNERIVILGAGESGTGAAVLAVKQGFEVFVSDAGNIKYNYRKRLEDYNIPYEEGSHDLKMILEADEVIKSPGVPDDTPVIREVRKHGIPVISEIEFAGRFIKGKKICVTGSNGKTTTTNLIWHMMKKAGLKVVMAGNVGKSLALKVAEEEADYYVIELSSFQLDGMYYFKADIAILLNITPDHLDRYGYDMENYINSKFRVIRNMGSKDAFIYCYDDPVLHERVPGLELAAERLPFSLKEKKGQTAWIENDELIINYKKNKITMSIMDLSLQGSHNVYNSLAAGITGRVLNIRKEVIRESLSDFKGVEHRLEPVLKVHGIQFINDSKATNVNSVWYALESMNTGVVWIAGGIDKGNDYSILTGLVKEKVKALICLGEDNQKLVEAFKDVVPTLVETHSMEEAVRNAYFLAADGDVVLLSPACASFDLFDNYEDRGRQFKRAVRNL